MSMSRNMVLHQGRSLMDWINLGQSVNDLTGTGSQPGSMKDGITNDELSKHNRLKDAWMAIRGKVYNVTPYFEYHPGGKLELMRGIGKDATPLFDGAHNWVNVESMLQKCYLGPYIPPNGSSVLISDKNERNYVEKSNHMKPRYTWEQDEKMVKIIIKTDRMKMSHECVLIDYNSVDENSDLKDVNTRNIDQNYVNTGNEMKITLKIDDYEYGIHLRLHSKVTTNYIINVDESLKCIYVCLHKKQPSYQWKVLGDKLEHNESYVSIKTGLPFYRSCQIISILPVNHDTWLYSIKLPNGSRVCVPVGHHVHIKAQIEGVDITRSYTVVRPSLSFRSTSNVSTDMGQLMHFMIKIYQDGALTSSINKLKVGDSIHVSNPEGKFDPVDLHDVNHLTLFAAGTGFTPMVSVLCYIFNQNINQEQNVTLVVFNKTEADILWKEELDTLQNTHQRQLQIHHILSQADDTWTGYKGRMSEEIVNQFLQPPEPEPGKRVYMGVCGPVPFTKKTVQLAKDIGYSDNMIHAFVG